VADATQSHLHLSCLGVNFTDPRRYALSILTTALGSQGGGIFFELRERRGLAYAVHVSSEEALDPGPVSFYAATAPESEEEVLDVMRREISRSREKGLDAGEIERAKAYLIGEHLRGNQRAGAKASGLAFDFLYGLKREGPEEFKKKIRAVRADEIRDVARDLLAPGKECLVRLGPPSGKKRKIKKSSG
jgi:zinc protease